MKVMKVTEINDFQPHTKSDGTWFSGGTVYRIETGEFEYGSLDSVSSGYTVYTKEDVENLLKYLATTA